MAGTNYMPDITDGWNTYACMRVAHTKYCVQYLRHSVVWRAVWARRSYVKRTRGRSCAAPQPDTNCSGEEQFQGQPIGDQGSNRWFWFWEVVVRSVPCPT